MTRPSRNTDQKLVEAALGMLQDSGLSGLKLRVLAKKAGVNLGMFHYHFKTKEAFTRRVLQEIYEKFFREFSLETSKDGTPLERLKAALLAVGRFVLGNRRMLFLMAHDVLNKDKVALDFVKTNFPRHILVVLGLVRQCQKEGAIRKMSLPTFMPLIIGSVVLPSLFLAMLEHLDIQSLRFVPLMLIRRELSSDKSLERRVDLALSTLTPRKGEKR